MADAPSAGSTWRSRLQQTGSRTRFLKWGNTLRFITRYIVVWWHFKSAHNSRIVIISVCAIRSSLHGQGASGKPHLGNDRGMVALTRRLLKDALQALPGQQHRLLIVGAVDGPIPESVVCAIPF
jgi:hypothetical protein